MTCLKANNVKGELQCPTVFVATMDVSREQMMCCPADVAERYTAQLLRDQMRNHILQTDHREIEDCLENTKTTWTL